MVEIGVLRTPLSRKSNTSYILPITLSKVIFHYQYFIIEEPHEYFFEEGFLASISVHVKILYYRWQDPSK
jgi:hypothetical protein